jgi:hypothetical protein
MISGAHAPLLLLLAKNANSVSSLILSDRSSFPVLTRAQNARILFAAAGKKEGKGKRPKHKEGCQETS